MKKEKQKKWLRILLWLAGGLTLIAVIAAGVIGYIFYDLINNPFNDRRFQETVWKEYYQNDDPDNPRGNMAYHLRDKVLKAGMSMDEVRAILGNPDYSETENSLQYNLGMWSGFRMDYDSFDIYFEEGNGGLTHVEIVQH